MSTRDEWLAKPSQLNERYGTTEGIIEWYTDINNPPSRSHPIIYYVEVHATSRRRGVFSSFINALKADVTVDTISFCGVSNSLMEYILYTRDFYNRGGDFTWYRNIPQGKDLGIDKKAYLSHGDIFNT